MSAKKVVVAISSNSVRQSFSAQVSRMSDFRVIATARDLMSTFSEVEAHCPDVVLISEDMSNKEEFEVMRALFETLDVRWLVVGSSTRQRPLPKRALGVPSDLFALPIDCSDSKLVAQLRSVTHSHARPLLEAKEASRATPDPSIDKVILIGSSTGGVDALLSVLKKFPDDCPPTLIVQHTGFGFGASLALLLDRQCRPHVHLVKEKRPLRRGEVLVGAGSKAHLQMCSEKGLFAELYDAAPVCGHMPSVDHLFRSALPVAHKVSAAILTGMGKDGASGLKALRQGGAHTIAQDESTSIVFGMPKAAIDCGAADQVLPISSVADALLSTARNRKRLGHA
jgi:two-component system chemotaxis response regulator CheB